KDETGLKAGEENAGVLLFLQYKLSEYLVGTNSTLKEKWGIPYYRFSVHPKSKYKRHDLLLSLEGTNHLVYYAAPEFHTLGELYSSLMRTAVLTHTTFWSPQSLGRFSKAEKYAVAYKRDTPIGRLQPEERVIEGVMRGDMFLKRIREKLDSPQSDAYDDNRLVQLGDQMLDNYLSVFYTPNEWRVVEDIRKGRERIDPRDYLSLISILLYDCFVYFVARK
ncbi:MAG: hypothetical protein JXB85_00155, partial [Anaerolineales bacterium]|nr:hypothetical protein [Anaerolineales bacterium]